MLDLLKEPLSYDSISFPQNENRQHKLKRYSIINETYSNQFPYMVEVCNEDKGRNYDETIDEKTLKGLTN